MASPTPDGRSPKNWTGRPGPDMPRGASVVQPRPGSKRLQPVNKQKVRPRVLLSKKNKQTVTLSAPEKPSGPYFPPPHFSPGAGYSPVNQSTSVNKVYRTY